jgi:hypothetical protein
VDVALADQGDCDEVLFEETYTFEVTPIYDEPDAEGVQDIVDWEYVWTDDPDDPAFNAKITEGGPGDCEANFELYSPDGKTYLLLKPHERELALNGQGSYELWADSRL